MDAKRLVPMVWIRDGQVVEPLEEGGWRSLGWPAERAARLELEGADGILFRACGAGSAWIREVASSLFIPFALEAPFAGLGDLEAALEEGADQVVLAAGSGPGLLPAAARRFGPMRLAMAVSPAHAGQEWRIGLDGAETEALAALEQLRWQGAGTVWLDHLAGHPLAGELLQGAARALLPVVAHASGAPAEAADLLLHGAEGVAFPFHAAGTAALKTALAGSGITLRF